MSCDAQIRTVRRYRRIGPLPGFQRSALQTAGEISGWQNCRERALISSMLDFDKTGRRFLAIADAVNSANRIVCALLMVAIVVAQLLVVVLRYVFATGFLELQDTVAYAFAVLVVLSIPVALRADLHVRVDIFRERQTIATRRRFDRMAVAVLLIPVFGLTLVHAMPGVIYSWTIMEGSVETGGLPGYFLVKTALPLTCALMILQGVAAMLATGDRSETQAGP